MGKFVRREYPAWSWSFSRDQVFKACLRRYYYNYYGSHNGWEMEAPVEAALAYRLKKLTNIYLVLGDAVHKSAARIVKGVIQGKSIPRADTVEEEIRYQLRRVWKSSRDDQNAFRQRPNRVDMLHEFYYSLGISEETIARVNRRAEASAQALVASCVWADLAREGTKLISCEQFDTFFLADTPVYAVPDLLYVTPENQWVIIDWKTGTEDESNNSQIALYTLYVQKKHGVSSEQIRARLEYLSLQTSQELIFSSRELKEVERMSMKSQDAMRALLLDTEQNIPHPKGAFALTKERQQCLRCNFYELCQKELAESIS